MADIRLYNIVMLGVCFMFLFTAFQTSGNIQTKLLNEIERDGAKIFKNKGYVSLALIYTVFALANFIAPPVVNLVGPRLTMIIGGLCYCVFIGSIIYPFVSTLYIASIIIGIGAGLLWTAQGNCFTLNSDSQTIGRNSGIFWTLFQSSLLFGNMFVYFYFEGKPVIDNHEREVVYTALLVCAGIGTLALVLLRRPPSVSIPEVIDRDTVSPSNDEDLVLCNVTRSQRNTERVEGQTPLGAFKKSFQLLVTKDILLLAITIAYTGFELSFFSGVYGTSIGNIDNSNLRDPDDQIGLIGMLIGAGEITGGLLFTICGPKSTKYGRDPIILFGFLAHMMAFYLIYLNVPNEAPLNLTRGDSWLNYNLPVYALCAFLLGFGDASFNTQIFSILGTLYSDDSAPAFALYQCIQSVAAALGFAYGLFLVLRYQLLILVVMCFAGTLTFFIVERKHAKDDRKLDKI